MTNSKLSGNKPDWVSFQIVFRSFRLNLSYRTDGTDVHVYWHGPRNWEYQIQNGCKMWVQAPMGMKLLEFLDKLDIGRNVPK